MITALLFLFLHSSGVAAKMANDGAETAGNGKGPLVIYYSRTGSTRWVAEELTRGLAAVCVEIQSKKDRAGVIGGFTCVLDQLLDRDDEQKKPAVDLSAYDPIIIASPIWIHRLSSPVRTFLKQANLAGKAVYFVLTYHGHQTDADEKEMKTKIRSCGIDLKGIYKLNTKNKDENHIRVAAVQLATAFDRRLVKR